MRFENAAEKAIKSIHYILDLIGVPFRDQVKDTLQGEALVGPGHDCIPYFIVHNMELREKASVCDILKASRGHALLGILDEVLDHIHTLHIASFLVHQVHIVLPAFHQVLLRHRADSVGGV